MINAVDTDDALVVLDRIPFLFHDTYISFFGVGNRISAGEKEREKTKKNKNHKPNGQ